MPKMPFSTVIPKHLDASIVPVVHIQANSSSIIKLLFTVLLLSENALIAVPNAITPRNAVPIRLRIVNVKNQPIEKRGLILGVDISGLTSPMTYPCLLSAFLLPAKRNQQEVCRKSRRDRD